ncbi:heavy metal sensor histidine kinase [Pseudomonas saliphila]|uniref:heavy metal sensor histidine kinase n=1 Tax=Pseudomonas saliphila TaxID=2586906 RepID=UPI00123B5ABD|nr:heavy metal sensor histidine kinase [Pseudomonas saliphila]
MTKPLSLSLRIGLSVGVMGSILVILIFSQSWMTLRNQLGIIAESRLEQKLNQIEHVISESNLSLVKDTSSHPLGDLVSGHPDLGLLVCDAQRPNKLNFTVGSVPSHLLTGSTCTVEPDTYKKRLSQHGIEALIESNIVRIAGSNESFLLVLFSNRSDDSELLSAYLNSTILAVPLFLVLIGFGSWWIARRGMAPLSNFRELTSIVTTNDLDGRIITSGLPVELKELADSVNFMLGRLEGGVQQLSDFSDDLAHELRSPITNLMGKAQVALSRDRLSSEYKETLESCVEELGRISRIVSDMLYLSQALQSDSADLSDQISLKREAEQVVDLFNIMAEEKGISLTVQGDGVIVGDRLMVQRAISNLLSNAIRHASHHSNIPILIESQGQSIVLSVTNDGPGIPEEHTEAIFKRFFRVDSGRSRDEGGTGLGLSIVRSIMQIHQGSVTVNTSTAGPTTFQLWFNLM